MILERFNLELRKILINLINDGYKKTDVANVTFGNNHLDQLLKFLNGRDIGGLPLKHMFESLDFEFHIVPIHKSKYKEREQFDQLASETLEALNFSLLNFLDDINNVKRAKKNIVIFVDEIIDKLNRGENLFDE